MKTSHFVKLFYDKYWNSKRYNSKGKPTQEEILVFTVHTVAYIDWYLLNILAMFVWEYWSLYNIQKGINNYQIGKFVTKFNKGYKERQN